MYYTLHDRQFVKVFDNNRIAFLHRTTTDYLLAFHLKPYQCENLNDIVQQMDLYRLRSYPLGGNIWFYKEDSHIQLVNHTTDRYFIFYPSSWREYKRRVHRRVMTLLRHGKPKNYKHHARHARRYRAQSRKPSSTIRRKTISRSARDVAIANEQRAQRAVIPSRHHTNPRPPSSTTSGEHASRSASIASTAGSISLSDFEHCNQCSVNEEETLSTKHECR